MSNAASSHLPSARTNGEASPANGDNLVTVFERTVARFATRTAAKVKHNGAWHDVTWAEMGARARAVACGLVEIGVQPGDRVAIIADTQLDWVVVHLGILGAGAVSVGIYQSSTPADCRYILTDSGTRWVFADSGAQVEKIRAVRADLPRLAGLIRMRGTADDSWELTLAELERIGGDRDRRDPAEHDRRVRAVGAGDVACLLYTSGTTGNPKGVMLTHSNWTYEAAAVGEIDLVNERDVALAFLPLAHSFAQVNMVTWLGTGSVAAFAESLDKIVDNASEVSPTVIPSVPRIFEKAFASVMQIGMSKRGLEGRLFRTAMNGFERWAAAKIAGREDRSFGFTIAQKVVFPKLAKTLSQRFGGRVRLFVSGGAPLAPKIAYFFEQLGIQVLEGWGLTETSAATCVNRPGHNLIGTVGPGVPGTELRIAPDGEIQVRGGGVMKGYWNLPEATAEVLAADGWFSTGDIGELEPGGELRITDRKKDIIVTAGGKNIAPQNLENELKTDTLVSQVMVHGDKRRFLSALFTLNEEEAGRWASQHGLAGLPYAELVRHPALKARVQRSVDALNAKQASYSTIKVFEILPRDFTIEAGELTPTLKVKRKFCSQKYSAILDSFYVE